MKRLSSTFINKAQGGVSFSIPTFMNGKLKLPEGRYIVTNTIALKDGFSKPTKMNGRSEEKGTENELHKLNVLVQYLKMPQGTHTNNLAHKLTTKISNAAQVDFNGRGTIAGKDFRLFIEGYDRLVNGPNTSTIKFFDAAVMNCAESHNALARIPLKNYLELRGLQDVDKARKQIKRDMEALKAIKFEYLGTGKRKGQWFNLSLYGGRDGIYNGIIEFRFTPEFYDSIPGNQFMFIPREYFATSDKYQPHTAYFIRRIAEHKRMNLGKNNENIIGVGTLVCSSPLFPKYEETKGCHFSQLILNPFERDMDNIKSFKWHYAEQQPKNYHEFMNSSVVITWQDYPDTETLKQHKSSSYKGGKLYAKSSKKMPNSAVSHA